MMQKAPEYLQRGKITEVRNDVKIITGVNSRHIHTKTF